MIIGKVMGSVWATRKNENLNGLKLMIVDITSKDSKTTQTIVAVDIVGAGKDETVLVTTGSSARFAVRGIAEDIPIDAAIVGIVDTLEETDKEKKQ